MSRSRREPSEERRSFVRAFQFRVLGRLYDPLVRALGVDTLRVRFIEQLRVEPGERLLDVGCGTGTLLLGIKALQPNSTLAGVDPDPDILSIATQKARRSGADMDLEVGFADRLPFPDGSFDRVVSTLAFHHFTRPEKEERYGRGLPGPKAWRNTAYRRLRKPQRLLVRVLTLPMAIGERTADNRAGRLPQFILEAGFTGVGEGERQRPVLGAVCIHQCGQALAPSLGVSVSSMGIGSGVRHRRLGSGIGSRDAETLGGNTGFYSLEWDCCR